MIIITEKRIQEKSYDGIKSNYNNGRLIIEIDCKKILKYLEYDIKNYGIKNLSLVKLANELNSRITMIAINDDHEFAQILSDL